MNQRGSQPVNRYNLRSSTSRLQQVSDLPQASQTTTASQVFQPPVTLIRSQSHSQLATQFHAHLHSPLQTTFVTQGPRLSSSTGSIPVSGQQHFSGSTLQDHLRKIQQDQISQTIHIDDKSDDKTGDKSDDSDNLGSDTEDLPTPPQVFSPLISPTTSPILFGSPAHSLSPVCSDSDEDSIMSSTALAPPPFRGLVSENSKRWISDLDHYCSYKKLDNPGKLGLIPLLLKDSARYWYDSLPDTDKDTFEHLTAAFKENFKRDSSIRWKDSANVWNLNQLSSQSVEDYISQVQQKASLAHMSDEQVRFSLLNGFLPEIRQSVLNHEPASVAEVKKWAIIAESGQVKTADTSTLEAVRRLEEKLDNLHTASVESTRRARSQSPRVHFQQPPDDRDREHVRNSSPSYRDSRGGFQNQHSNQGRNQQDARPQENRFDNNYDRGSFRNQGQHQGWRGNQGRSNYGSRSAAPRDNNQGQFVRQCNWCGSTRSAHDKFSCPARGARCFNCSLIGHFSRVCRRAQPSSH